MRRGILIVLIVLPISVPSFGSVLFDFDNAPLHSPLPVDVTAGGITAHLSATGQGFSIQEAGVLGFTPANFSGLCVYPSSVFPADLLVSFDTPLTGFSILYAPEEYATDSSATMRVTAFLGATFVGTDTHSIDPPGTWPSGTLSITTVQPFDNVIVHYDQPPITGGDYGPIFMADNMDVTAAPIPEPLGAAFVILLPFLGRRVRDAYAFTRESCIQAPPG